VSDSTPKEPSNSGTSPPPSARAQVQAPLWLAAVRHFERLVGVPVERMVTSDAYFDAVPKLRRAQTQMADFVASITDDWFRLYNLPSGSDVRRMREQLSRMERQLEKLTKELADSRDGGNPTAGKRKTTP
jgi:hypothetical protein